MKIKSSHAEDDSPEHHTIKYFLFRVFFYLLEPFMYSLSGQT